MTGGKRRTHMIADRKLQGTLLAHTMIYWFYCLFSVTLIAVCWIIFTKQPESSSELFTQLWLNCGPALLGSVLLLPLVLLDCVRLSNRFAGPMVRMQKVMQQLAAGESPAPITLRPGDYWSEFAEHINVVMERLRQQESQTQTTCPPTATTAAVAPSAEVAAIAEVITSETPVDAPAADSETKPIGSPIAAPLDSQPTAQSIYSELSL